MYRYGTQPPEQLLLQSVGWPEACAKEPTTAVKRWSVKITSVWQVCGFQFTYPGGNLNADLCEVVWGPTLELVRSGKHDDCSLLNYITTHVKVSPSSRCIQTLVPGFSLQ
jgi:hypothetical protein